MIDWKKEAEFVLELLKKDDDIMFSDYDNENTLRKNMMNLYPYGDFPIMIYLIWIKR